MIAAVILAAGESQRFGTPKQLAVLRGQPLLAQVVAATAANDRLDQVVIVLGHEAEQISSRVDFGRGRPVDCPDWARGMSASLRCGLQAVREADVAVLLLGDEPDVGVALVDTVLDSLRPADWPRELRSTGGLVIRW